MKIRITVQPVRRGSESWSELYDRSEIPDLPAAEIWAADLVRKFNDTLRPGESRRLLLKTELLGASTTAPHDWYKHTAGMSVEFRGRLVDTFECRTCGVKGKRFSFGGVISRDAKYRAKKYANCSGVRVDGEK